MIKISKISTVHAGHSDKKKHTEKQTKGKPAQRTPTRGTKFHMESLKRSSRKMLHITPRGITKKTPFEAHMGRKVNNPLSNKATNSSPDNLIWEKRQTRLFRWENLMQPTIPAEIMSDLRKWSEDEIRVKRRITEPAIIQHTPAKDSIKRKIQRY